MGKHPNSLSSAPMESGERASGLSWSSCIISWWLLRHSPIPYNSWVCAWKFFRTILIPVAVFFGAFWTVVPSVTLSHMFLFLGIPQNFWFVCWWLFFYSSIVSSLCYLMDLWYDGEYRMVSGNITPGLLSWSSLLLCIITIRCLILLNNQSSIITMNISS